MLRPLHAKLVKTFDIVLGDGWYGSPFFCRLDEDSEGLQSVNLLIRHLCHQLVGIIEPKTQLLELSVREVT